MLVVSRKIGQKIMIGEDIVVMVVDIDHGQVKVGVSAPIDVEVDREEVRKSKELWRK